MPLWLVIENTPVDELAPMPSKSSSDFIEAALHTAKHSKPETRDVILADVCEVLSCHPEDLKFLFQPKPSATRNRFIMDLELPDYRMNRSDIYKEAAE